MDIKNFNSPKLTGVNTRPRRTPRRKRRRYKALSFTPYARGRRRVVSERPPHARLPPSPPRPPDPLPDIRNLNSGLQCVLLQDIKKDRCLEKYLLDRQVAGSGGAAIVRASEGEEGREERAGEIRAKGREGAGRGGWVVKGGTLNFNNLKLAATPQLRSAFSVQ